MPSRGGRKIVVRRLGFKRCHVLKVGDSRYPGDDNLGQADRALCGVWVGFAYSPHDQGLEVGQFIRLSSDTALATCPRCRAVNSRK